MIRRQLRKSLLTGILLAGGLLGQGAGAQEPSPAAKAEAERRFPHVMATMEEVLENPALYFNKRVGFTNIYPSRIQCSAGSMHTTPYQDDAIQMMISTTPEPGGLTILASGNVSPFSNPTKHIYTTCESFEFAEKHKTPLFVVGTVINAVDFGPSLVLEYASGKELREAFPGQ